MAIARRSEVSGLLFVRTPRSVTTLLIDASRVPAFLMVVRSSNLSYGRAVFGALGLTDSVFMYGSSVLLILFLDLFMVYAVFLMTVLCPADLTVFVRCFFFHLLLLARVSS